MKIKELIDSFLNKLKVILNSPEIDRRCYGNIEYILNHKAIFGKRTSYHAKFDPKFTAECFKRFETHLLALLNKQYYPANKKEETLQAFLNIFSPNQKNIEIFKDTQLKSNMSDDVLRQTVILEGALTSGSIFNVVTKIDVLNIDSFEAAKNMLQSGISCPLVLNLANRFSAGGGVTIGSRAQEEDLMRRSNYYLSLSQDRLCYTSQAGSGKVRRKYHSPIPEVGSIYTPKVSVFKGPDYNDIKPFEVACLAVAGYDLGKPAGHPANELKLFLDPTNQFNVDLFKEKTKNKIRHILDVAIFKGHANLVLGALSCGAFQLKNQPGVTARAVANAYKEVLMEGKYQQKFNHIVFAILDNNPTIDSNFTIFNQTLDELKNQSQIAKPLTFSRPIPTSSSQTNGGKVPSFYASLRF